MAKNDLPTIGGDFVQLVGAMMDAQELYFKTRGSKELHEAKRLERLVRAMIGGYRRDVERLRKWAGVKKTDEERGQYNLTME